MVDAPTDIADNPVEVSPVEHAYGAPDADVDMADAPAMPVEQPTDDAMDVDPAPQPSRGDQLLQLQQQAVQPGLSQPEVAALNQQIGNARLDLLNHVAMSPDNGPPRVLAGNVNAGPHTAADITVLTRDLFPGLDGINPVKLGPLDTNCHITTQIVDSMLAGNPPQVAPKAGTIPDLKSLEQRMGGRFQARGSLRNLVAYLDTLPPGSRGIIAYDKPFTNVTGHLINVVKLDPGHLVFLDGQSGGLATLPPAAGNPRYSFMPTHIPGVQTISSPYQPHSTNTTPFGGVATDPRTVTATTYDVVELPAHQGVPKVVADSYRSAGLDVPTEARPDVGRIDGLIAFDHRTLPGGKQDFTVRVHLNPTDSTAAQQQKQVEQQTRDAVDSLFNTDDRLNVTVEFTDDPAAAHTTINLSSTPVDTTQTQWSTSDSGIQNAHEIGHYLGLPDEYADTGPIRRVLNTTARDDNSLMATTDPDSSPEVLPRHVDKILETAETAPGSTTEDHEGALGTRPAPPPRVPGGTNQAFDNLVRNRIPVTADSYRSIRDNLMYRDTKTSEAPMGFVVNMMVSAADVHRLPQVINSIAAGMRPDTPVAFVVGVNTTATSPNSALQRGVDQATQLAQSMPFPIAIAGHAVGAGKSTFPYGKARNAVLNSSETKAAVEAFAANRAYPYVAFQDFDTGARTTGSGKHVFNQLQDLTAYSDDEPDRPMMMTGGYRVGDAAELIKDTRHRLESRVGNEKGPAKQRIENAIARLNHPGNAAQFVSDFSRAISDDMQTRDRQSKIHPLLPYAPEPNLFVDGLLIRGNRDVQFGDGAAEYGQLSTSLNRAYAEELAADYGHGTLKQVPKEVRQGQLQVDAQNYRHPKRGQAFLVDYADSAVPTDLSRLAADVIIGKALPQSHTSMLTVSGRFFGYDAGYQVPGGPSGPKQAKAGTGLTGYATSSASTASAFTTPVYHPATMSPYFGGSGQTAVQTAPSWTTSLTPQQKQQLGGQTHNTLSPAISMGIPGTSDTIGLPSSQKLYAAQQLSLSNTANTIRQEFANAASVVNQSNLGVRDTSIYSALAAQLNLDANRIRERTLATGQNANASLLEQLADQRRENPYRNGHFVVAAIGAPRADTRAYVPSAARAESTSQERDQLRSAYDVLTDVIARDLGLNIHVHTPQGTVRHTAPGATQTLHVDRTRDSHDRIVFRPRPSSRPSPLGSGPVTGGKQDARTPDLVPSPAPKSEIDAQRSTVTPRTANTSAFDVVESAPTGRGVPDIVAESYRAAGLEAPATARPDVTRVEGPIAYDYRALPNGVRDFTVKVHLDPQDATAREQRADVEQRAKDAVDSIFNQGFRIGDGQLNVNVEFTDDPAEAHTTVELHGDVRTTQTEWSTTSSDVDLAHEIGHYLGLSDENVDNRVFNRTPESAAVYSDNSLMTSADPDSRPEVFQRHLDKIDQTAEAVLSADRGDNAAPRPSADRDRGGLGSRPAPPPKVSGGRNRAFDDLVARQVRVDGRSYPIVRDDLIGRRAPMAFVVNMMVPASDVARLPQVMNSIIGGMQPGTRVAFVVGVNTPSSSVSRDLERGVAQAVQLANQSPWPVAVTGHAVGKSKSTGSFLYGRGRNAILDSSALTSAVQAYAATGAYPYVSFQDFDTGARTTDSGTHVFDQLQELTAYADDDPDRPLMLTGGYRVGSAAELIRDTRDRLDRRIGKEKGSARQKLRDAIDRLDDPGNAAQFVRDFTNAVRDDMQTRDRQAEIHPLLPYAPEPNLFVDGLLTVGRPGVRFGEGSAEFGQLSTNLNRAYADELATTYGDARDTRVQVDSQNNRHPSRGRGFLVDYADSAVPTDLSRLAADVIIGKALPQSHTSMLTVSGRFFGYDAGNQVPGGPSGPKQAKAGTGLTGYASSSASTANAFTTPAYHPAATSHYFGGTGANVVTAAPSWATTLSPAQKQQLGGQSHNTLNPAISLGIPGTSDSVGLPSSQKLYAAQQLSLSNTANTIRQEFANAAAIARQGVNLRADSVFNALAANLNLDGFQIRDRVLGTTPSAGLLEQLADRRRENPYRNGHFVVAALGAPRAQTGSYVPDASTAESSRREREQLRGAYDVVLDASARALGLNIDVHTRQGTTRYAAPGATGTVHVERSRDNQDRVVFGPYPPTRPSPLGTGPVVGGKQDARTPETVEAPASRAQIDALREQTPPRRANTSAFDVVEQPATDRGVPDFVAESYRAAGLEVPTTARPQVGRVDGPIAYDYRALPNGVRDFTVKVHLDPQDPTARDQRAEVEQRAKDAVDSVFNQGFRIGDGQLNVTVEFTDDPADAHATIELHGDAPNTQTTWSTTATDLDLAHEIGHYLGLRDENVDNRVFNRTPESAAVYSDNSLMTSADPADRPEIFQRHVDRINEIADASLSPDNQQQIDDNPEGIGVALTTDGDLALPAPEAVRQSLPAYLKESRTLGLAEQTRATDRADLATPLRALAPGLPAEVVADLQQDIRDDVDQFLGTGRPYPVVIDGKPAELIVTATLGWDGVRVTGKSDAAGQASSKTEATGTHSLRHSRDKHLEPKATVTVMPPAVFGAGASIPTGPATTHSTANRTTFTTTTSVEVEDQAEVSVPITFTATLRGVGTATAEGEVPLRVPTKLAKPPALPARSPDDPPLDAAPPKRFGVESVVSRPADNTFFDQAAKLLEDQGLGDITRLGAPGRTVLQQFFSEANISAKLGKMVVHDPTDRHQGWVTSDALLRAHEKPWRRLFPGRNRAVQMRLVARQVQVVETVDRATHTDTSAFASENTDLSSADRPFNLWGMAGGGTDVPLVTFLVGPKVSATRKGPNTQEIKEESGTRQTLTASGPAVRYRTVYDLQVRPIGQPARELDGTVETLQWTTQDRIRDTALDPDRDLASWRGRTGTGRTHFAPPPIEHGKSFGGAFINDLRGGDKIYEAVAEALRSVPGKRGFTLHPDTFVQQFDDPAFAEGINAGVQAILSRDTDARTMLSNRQLRYLLDRIVGPGLQIPLIKQGKLYDYTSVVTVSGALTDLSDGDLIDRGDFEAGDKHKSKTTTTAGQERSRTVELSLEARILGPVGRAFSTLLGGPKASRTSTKAHEIGVSRGRTSEATHAPGLTEEGKLGDRPMREFAGTLQITATTESSVRPNQNARHLVPGSPGRGLPDVVATTSNPPTSYELKVHLLVPEHRVSTTPPPAVPSREPRDPEWIEHPAPLSRMTGGYPHDLTGSQVESFLGAEHLQAAAKEALTAASKDPIYGFADGRISTVIADALSPERLAGDPEVFTRPVALSNLRHGRRSADADADARVRLRPTNPRILPDSEFARVKDVLSGGSATRSKHGRSYEVSTAITGVASVTGTATDHGDTKSTPGGVVVATLTPWQRTWGGTTDDSLTGVGKLKIGSRPERRVLVQLDVAAEVIAEARHEGNLDVLDVLPGEKTQRAGQSFTLPDSVLMWMTESQVQQMREHDLARTQQDNDVKLQQWHAGQATQQQAEHDAERARQTAEHRRERADLRRHQWNQEQQDRAFAERVDRRTEPARREQLAAAIQARVAQHHAERVALTARQQIETADLRQSQQDRQDSRLDRQQRERDIVAREQQRQRDDLAGQRPAPAAEDPRGAALGPAPDRSLGLGGVDTTVDLSDRIPHLRRRIADTVGDEIADALLPQSALDTPHDNVRALQTFLANAQSHVGGALNGGRTLPLRIEGRFRGHTYQATLTADFVQAPTFTGIEQVEDLTVSDSTTVSHADTRSKGSTVGSVSVTLRAQGTVTEDAQSPAHGPASQTVGGGYVGTANLGVRTTDETNTEARTYAQSLTTHGPVAAYRGKLGLDITVTGNGLGPDGLTLRDVRDVGLHTHPGSSRPNGPLGVARPATRLPADQLTDDAREQWRTAEGHDTLPENAAVEHVLVDLTDLHRAGEQALADSGVQVDETTRSAIRDGLTGTNLKAGLPAMLAGRFPVPVPGRLGRDLFVDARLVPLPRFAGADATVEVTSSVERARGRKVERSTGHTYAVKMNGPVVAGGVNHPASDNAVGERDNFGAVNASTFYEQPLYSTDPTRRQKAEAALRDDHTGSKPVTEPADDTMTRSLSYGIEFRLVARSQETTPKHSAGSQVTVADAATVRMPDAAARERTGTDLSPELRRTATEVATRGREWTTEDAWWDAQRAHQAELDKTRRQEDHDRATPAYLRTQRFDPAADPIVSGTHLLRGENTTINFRVRELPGPVRAFDVHLDLVSRNNTVPADARREYAERIRQTVEENINGRYTFADGHRLQVNLTFDTPAWRDGMLDDWDGDPDRNPPVEITTSGDTHQHSWNLTDSPDVGVHEVLHFLGAKEGYSSADRLFRTPDRPGVMGTEARTGPADYLTDTDLATIADVARTAGPRPVTVAAPTEATPVQTPSRAPGRPETRQEAAEQYEQRLATHLYQSDRVRQAATRTVERLREVLAQVTPNPPAQGVRRSFVQDLLDSSGQAGTQTTGEDLRALLTDGNLREVMTAYYNGAYFNRTPPAGEPSLKDVVLDIVRSKDWARSDALGLNTAELRSYAEFLDNPLRPAVNAALTAQGKNPAPLTDDPFTPANLIARSQHWQADASEQQRSRRVARSERDQKRGPQAVTPRQLRTSGAELGRYETAYLQRPGQKPFVVDTEEGTAEHTEPWRSWLRPDEQGPELPLPWVSGHSYFAFDTTSDWYKEVHDDAAIPVTAGPSLTTSRLLTAFRWLNVPGVSEQEFLGALAGWMMAADDHSLYEILRGGEIAGVPLPGLRLHDLTSSDELYDSLARIGLDTPAGDRPADVSVTRSFLDPGIQSPFPGPAGHFTLLAHGTADGVVRDGRPMTPEQLADFVRTDPAWHGQPITLAACDTGIPQGYAHRLSELLPGTTIHAPDGPVWTTPSGEAFVTGTAGYDPDGRPRPQLPPTGSWRTYYQPSDTTGTRTGPYLSGTTATRPLNPELYDADRMAPWGRPFAERPLLTEPQGPQRYAELARAGTGPRTPYEALYQQRLDGRFGSFASVGADEQADIAAIYENLNIVSSNDPSVPPEDKQVYADWETRNGMTLADVLARVSPAQAAAVYMYTNGNYPLVNAVLEQPSDHAAPETPDEVHRKLTKITDKDLRQGAQNGPNTAGILKYDPRLADLRRIYRRTLELQTGDFVLDAVANRMHERNAEIAPEVFQEMRIHGDMAIDGLRRLPATRDTAVFRGNEDQPALVVGHEFAVKSLTSTSRDNRQAVEFLPSSGPRMLLDLRLTGYGGRDINIFSAFPVEAEVLLLPGTRFRVDEVTDVDDLDGPYRHIVATEIPPAGFDPDADLVDLDAEPVAFERQIEDEPSVSPEPTVVRSLLNPEEAATRAMPAHPGHYTLYAHGTADGVVVNDVTIPAEHLADLIRQDPAWHGQPITLVVCDTGRPDGYAAQLARHLPGTRITAPDHAAWTTPGGHAYVSGTVGYTPDGRPKPKLPPTGAWHTFVASPAEVEEVGEPVQFLTQTAPNPLTADLADAQRWAPWGRPYQQRPMLDEQGMKPRVRPLEIEYEDRLGETFRKSQRAHTAVQLAAQKLRAVILTYHHQNAAWVKGHPVFQQLDSDNVGVQMSAVFTATASIDGGQESIFKALVQDIFNDRKWALSDQLGLWTPQLKKMRAFVDNPALRNRVRDVLEDNGVVITKANRDIFAPDVLASQLVGLNPTKADLANLAALARDELSWKAARMMTMYRLLNITNAKTADFLQAFSGWMMLPKNNSYLRKLMVGAEVADTAIRGVRISSISSAEEVYARLIHSGIVNGNKWGDLGPNTRRKHTPYESLYWQRVKGELGSFGAINSTERARFNTLYDNLLAMAWDQKNPTRQLINWERRNDADIRQMLFRISKAQIFAVWMYTSGNYPLMNAALEREANHESPTMSLSTEKKLLKLVGKDIKGGAQNGPNTAGFLKYDPVLADLRARYRSVPYIDYYEPWKAKSLTAQMEERARLIAPSVFREMRIHNDMAVDGLRMLPAARDISTYRGNPDKAEYQVGHEFSVKSLTSTSRVKDNGIGFMPDSEPAMLLDLRLKGYGGRDIDIFSVFVTEAEVLLLPGTRFRVVKVTKRYDPDKGGYRHIVAEEIRPIGYDPQLWAGWAG
ncbi:toxin glutamine deamidase domain-containing protein [Actinoplanes friuliensis]|uniref:Yd repeat-containing protein n=1 Tax=Actinoplanes friuliensis DSM 7358 TaxID=1246995 RepID=U5VPP8_9ACTN|nr:toxin glutamine deamidase domain-containing protein [Actinoplanes friuliensis]AGZ38787.1 yd repeat-containing protein [Actinoplanes friuliensis DSM 7358]